VFQRDAQGERHLGACDQVGRQAGPGIHPVQARGLIGDQDGSRRFHRQEGGSVQRAPMKTMPASPLAGSNAITAGSESSATTSSPNRRVLTRILNVKFAGAEVTIPSLTWKLMESKPNRFGAACKRTCPCAGRAAWRCPGCRWR